MRTHGCLEIDLFCQKKEKEMSCTLDLPNNNLMPVIAENHLNKSLLASHVIFQFFSANLFSVIQMGNFTAILMDLHCGKVAAIIPNVEISLTSTVVLDLERTTVIFKASVFHTL